MDLKYAEYIMVQYIHDRFNYISKFTFKKAVNTALLKSSFYLARWMKKNFRWGRPNFIQIESTTSCNLKCPECLSGLHKLSRGIGIFSEELFKKIIDENHKYLTACSLNFIGEPYLHKSLFRFINYLSKRKIYSALSTNGHFLDEENAKKTILSGLDSIMISIDGTTQDVYSAYRAGGNIEKVTEGINNIVKWKRKLNSSTPYIVIQFVIFKHNEHQIKDIKTFSQKTGVNKLVLKTAHVHNSEKTDMLAPSVEKYSRYTKQKDGTFKIKSKSSNHCWLQWHSCVITWNGMVIPCCFDRDAQYCLGDAKKESLTQILKNDKYNGFRSAILSSRSEIKICRDCLY